MYPPVWNLLHVDALAPRILRWTLDFSKMCSPASGTSSGSILDVGTEYKSKGTNHIYGPNFFTFAHVGQTPYAWAVMSVRPSVCLYFTAQLCNQLKFHYLLINQASNKTSMRIRLRKLEWTKAFPKQGNHTVFNTLTFSLTHTHTLS